MYLDDIQKQRTAVNEAPSRSTHEHALDHAKLHFRLGLTIASRLSRLTLGSGSGPYVFAA